MEPAQFVRVRFSGDYVAGLSGANGKTLDVVRPGAADDRRHLPEKPRRPHPDQDRPVPPYLLETLVATEDRDFYSHFGVSPKSIARAMWVNTSAGSMRRGAVP